jgi:anti-sigma-K factor RskA
MSFNSEDPRITAYIFDELDASERTAFEAEIRSSDELRRAIDGTRRTLSALEVELKAEPALNMSADQRATVSKEIESKPAKPADTKVAPRRIGWRGWIAMARWPWALRCWSLCSCRLCKPLAKPRGARRVTTI